MTARTAHGRPRLINGTRQGPAVHTRYRLRLRVDHRGFVQPRSADDPKGFMPQYQPGTVVEIDTGQGRVLLDYDAVCIAEQVAHCAAVHLVSSAANGSRPHIQNGAAHNADGVLHLLHLAIERVASHRGAPAC
ncbi:hypothetical protein [Streptomyces sp. NPDC020996]|uniref:hypothetical protein n=1 Tax=Streptomyces sp. NPDC020996 TaxID=3154791 RepID=UPI0033F3F358